MKLVADLSPLRESAPFLRLWAGSTLSLTGSALTRFAVVLQVYDITRSPTAVGLIGLAVMVPLLVVGLLGGALIDTADRRVLAPASTRGNMAVAAAIAARAGRRCALGAREARVAAGAGHARGTGPLPPGPVPGGSARR